jgi:hypothetical protein
MKAALVLDQFCDVTQLTDELRPLVAFVPGHRGKMDAIFPAGTIFTGDQALAMCMTGQCSPADEECVKALGWPEEKLRAVQLNCKMNCLGINRKEDRELYAAGVIAGYDKELNYIHGPNWAKYQAAKEDVAKSEDDI